MKPKILYVEDDLYLGYVTKDNLQLKGYEVFLSEDGVKAFDMFNEKKPDICVLDVMLPKMDGFQLAKKIRASNNEIPIIFLTAKTLKEDKIEGLTLGGDDYITKPFNIEELVLKIEIFLKRRKIDQKHKPEISTFRLGQYLFDFSKLELQIDNHIQRLTLKEAQILRIFCLNQNSIIKREQILNEVWGKDDYFKGRSLDVFISRIRKYLSKDPALKIENIHSVGFEIKIVDI